MINNYLAIVEFNQNESNTNPLLNTRPQPSLPVGGRYRIIDFSLSNISNAGINNVFIVEPTKDSASLREHVGSGSPWDLDRKNSGIRFISKYSSFNKKSTIQDFERNLFFFNNSKEENVLLINTSMVYNIDFNEVFKSHESDNRDITMVYKKIENDNSGKFYEAVTLDIDGNSKITNLGRNLLFSKQQNIFMEALVVKKSVFIKLIAMQIERQEYGSFRDILLKNFKSLDIKGFEFNGYLAQINSIKEYYDFNMDLLVSKNTESLLNSERHIFTKRKDTPSTIYKNSCNIENSLVSNGCQISGTVKNSILGRRVVIEEGAIVENCIILQNCIIKSGAHLRCVIVDQDNIVPRYETLHSSPIYPLVLERKLNINKNIWDSLIGNSND